MQFKCFEIELFKLIALFCFVSEKGRERRMLMNISSFFWLFEDFGQLGQAWKWHGKEF